MNHLHILGIGGTFMSALALIAREAGFKVTGCDINCYPPVSDLLKNEGIYWEEGYEVSNLALQADCVIVGNAIKRGMPIMEAVLNGKRPFVSGPNWLATHILPKYRVMAVTGTHGKTTTTSMLAYILDFAKLNPGFLIGGVSSDFNTSARLGRGSWFVIEADEYDSAFFDKRPKLMHYLPEVAIINNLEFDHADIYPNLEAIQQQFHYFLKTIPQNGTVIKPENHPVIDEVLSQGCYSHVETLSIIGDATWQAKILTLEANHFEVFYSGKKVAEVHWSLIGRFNVENALAAMAASYKAGVVPQVAANALMSFTPVKRRLEVKYQQQGITIYDDFAHHPTAIANTIDALKQSARHQRIIVVLEFASYTMRSGFHMTEIEQALKQADTIFILRPQFDLNSETWQKECYICETSQDIIQSITTIAQAGDGILIMSNRGFDNIHQRLAQALTHSQAGLAISN